MKQIIYQNFSKSSVPKEFIGKFLKRLRRYLPKQLKAKERRRLLGAKELILVLVTNEKMRELNKQYRGHDRVTDILSFSSEDRKSLGELVISPAKIRSQARLHRLSTREELIFMLIHGVLHLLGFEHEKSKAKAKRMFQLQDKAFECLSRPRPRAKK